MLDGRLDTLRDRVSRLRESVATACASVGRKETEIEIVAATKCVPGEIIYQLPKYGITQVGENRVQEFADKYDPTVPLEWHVIGALQTNKVKQIIGKVKLVQSVDRPSLIAELERISAQNDLVTEVLAEVNICGEPNKSGLRAEALDELAAQIVSMPHLKLRGLMCVPPIDAEFAVYDRAYGLYSRLKSDYKVDIFSIGMSGDYETAIRAGSTMIRPGRVLFGERKPKE